MSAAKSFLIGTLKVALAIIVSVVALSAIGWVVYVAYETHQKSKNEDLARPKAWKEITMEHWANAKLSLRTIWRDGRMSYEFSVDGYPKALEEARNAAREASNAKFMLNFEDKNGFRLFVEDVHLTGMARMVDERGKPRGLSYEGDRYLSADDYRLVANWAIRWSFPEAASPPAPTPRVANEVDDHCAPGLSKAERLRRLAKHGRVRQTRENTYSVGYRVVTFYSEFLGGQMMDCR